MSPRVFGELLSNTLYEKRCAAGGVRGGAGGAGALMCMRADSGRTLRSPSWRGWRDRTTAHTWWAWTSLGARACVPPVCPAPLTHAPRQRACVRGGLCAGWHVRRQPVRHVRVHVSARHGACAALACGAHPLTRRARRRSRTSCLRHCRRPCWRPPTATRTLAGVLLCTLCALGGAACARVLTRCLHRSTPDRVVSKMLKGRQD